MSNKKTKSEKKTNLLQREIKYNQKPFIVWFTGLSGSGKTTLAVALENIYLNATN